MINNLLAIWDLLFGFLPSNIQIFIAILLAAAVIAFAVHLLKMIWDAIPWL